MAQFTGSDGETGRPEVAIRYRAAPWTPPARVYIVDAAKPVLLRDRSLSPDSTNERRVESVTIRNRMIEHADYTAKLVIVTNAVRP